MRFENEKTHMLQGIKDDFYQMDNKRLEMIEWYQEKEKIEGESMLDMNDI